MCSVRVGRFVAILLFFAILPMEGFAATIYWDGGGADANWTTVANWSGSTIPDYDDTAVFNATSTKNVMITSRSGASIDVRHGYTGTIETAQNSVVTFNKVTLGASASRFRVGTGATLVLKGSRVPLSGSGTFDASTYAGAIVKFVGPGLTTVTGSSVFPSLRLEPLVLGTGGTVLASVDYAYNGAIDPNGGYAYFISAWPGYVIRVRLSDHTVQSMLDSALDFPRSVAIDTVNGFLYVGDEGGSTPKIAKIRLSDFTEVGTLTLQSGSGRFLQSAVIDTTNGFLYFGTRNDTPGKIVKIRLSDFTYVGNLTLSAGQTLYGYSTNPSAIDVSGGYAYFGLNTSPGGIAKIRLSDFTQVDTLSFNSGEGGVMSLSIDASSGFLYASTSDSPGKIVKVRLSDFSRIGSLTLNTGETSYSSSIHDGKLYLSLYTTPAKVGVIRLSDFTRTDTVTFHSSDALPYPVLIDGTGGYLYTGTLQAPLRILRMSLGTSDIRLGRSIATANSLTIGTGAVLSLGSHVITASQAAVQNYGVINEQTGRIVHTSSLSGPGSLTLGNSLVVTLNDADENIDGTVRDSVNISINGEPLTLTETSNTSGIFTGFISTRYGIDVPGNGVVENSHNCSFSAVARFSDAQDSTDIATANTTVTNSDSFCDGTDLGGGLREETLSSHIRSGAGKLQERRRESQQAGSLPALLFPLASSGSKVRQMFADVPPSAWFFPFISLLAEKNIVSGYRDTEGNPTGFYGPANPVTRAEILKMALLASGKSPGTGIPNNRSALGTWASPYIITAESLSLPFFASDRDIFVPATRGEVVQILLEVFHLPETDITLPDFIDVSDSHPYALAIATAKQYGLIEGDRGQDGELANTFRPAASVNRAEAAAMVVRTMAIIDEISKQ